MKLIFRCHLFTKNFCSSSSCPCHVTNFSFVRKTSWTKKKWKTEDSSQIPTSTLWPCCNRRPLLHRQRHHRQLRRVPDSEVCWDSGNHFWAGKQPKRKLKQRQGVNFMNILRTIFSYDCCYGSFFCVHVTREKLPKQRLYKKFVHKMLMKLTTVKIRSHLLALASEVKPILRRLDR
jgi:hypothetical protein